MNINECICGRKHVCEIREIIIEENALKKIKTATENYKRILIIADENTFKTCGKKVKNILAESIENILIYKREKIFVPDEKAIDEAEEFIKNSTDFILGIGSGVIQDLCKYVSFKHNLSYGIIATAPSMDGYASSGAAMIINNMKVTYSCHVPEIIIGDVNILKDAPMDLIKSGYGDIIGKYSCLNDWKLSTTVNGEYFCEYVYDLTFNAAEKVKNIGPALLKREKDAVKILTEALVKVGVAMSFAGNSRPASGSEHHLSHFFEITGLMENKPYFLHGIDVAFSSFYTQKIREKILKIPSVPERKIFDEKDYENKISSVYSSASKSVIELQKNLGWYDIDRNKIYRENFGEIKKILSEAPSSEKIKSYLESVNLDLNDFEKLYGKDKINNALFFAKDLKNRYTVLWMYYDIFYK